MRNFTHVHLLSSVGRDNLLPVSEIPTAAEAAVSFYRWQRGRGHKSLKDVKSIIGGAATTRRVGRQPAAPSFGDYFGARPCHRITANDVVNWFGLRIPAHSSESFRQKAKSFVSVFLDYCHTQRWIPASVLIAADQIGIGEAQGDERWMTPEQVVVYDRIVAESDRLDAWDRFVWATYKETGIRTFEGPKLTPASLSRQSRKLSITGKGSGPGKRREVTASAVYVESVWQPWITDNRIHPSAPMMYARRKEFQKGEKDVHIWVPFKGDPASTKSIRGAFARIQAAIEEAVETGVVGFNEVAEWKLDPKVMRKTFACNQLILDKLGLGGMNVVQLQSALGHASLTETRRYLADVHDYLGEAIERVSTTDAAEQILDWKRRNRRAKT